MQFNSIGLNVELVHICIGYEISIDIFPLSVDQSWRTRVLEDSSPVSDLKPVSSPFLVDVRSDNRDSTAALQFIILVMFTEISGWNHNYEIVST